jgi:lipoprotein-anchoring transpeptidase ErfK/SrfK
MSRPTSRHKATQVRPRYARMGAAVASLCVTLVAVLGGFGVLPVDSTLANASEDPSAGQQAGDEAPTADQGATEADAGNQDATQDKPKKSKGTASADSSESSVDPQLDATLPEGSGVGKRVVFSESRQRVWLVDENENVERTYLVSGSVYDNLEPGAFNVYSRSEDAWGVDDSGSMKYFVRFTQGDTGAAIGFHDIPVKDGELAQTEAQLGTPTSHGCIRQRRSDAVALWEFAPLGTSVIVTA